MRVLLIYLPTLTFLKMWGIHLHIVAEIEF